MYSTRRDLGQSKDMDKENDQYVSGVANSPVGASPWSSNTRVMATPRSTFRPRLSARASANPTPKPLRDTPSLALRDITNDENMQLALDLHPSLLRNSGKAVSRQVQKPDHEKIEISGSPTGTSKLSQLVYTALPEIEYMAPSSGYSTHVTAQDYLDQLSMMDEVQHYDAIQEDEYAAVLALPVRESSPRLFMDHPMLSRPWLSDDDETPSAMGPLHPSCAV